MKSICSDCRHFKNNECDKMLPGVENVMCDGYEGVDFAGQKVSDPSQRAEIERIIESENEQDNSIGGWLLFFLTVFVGLGSLVTFCVNAIALLRSGFAVYFVGDLIFSIIYAAIGIFTIIAFRRRDSDAVLLAKTFVITCFASNIIMLYSAEPGEWSEPNFLRRTITSMVWCIIWFIYLLVSKRVKRIIPSHTRKAKTRDAVLISALILTIILSFGYGAYLGLSQSDTEYTEYTETFDTRQIASNQRFDSNIIFTIPEGMSESSRIDDNGYKYFSLSTPEEDVEITIVSGMDDDISQTNFNEHWQGWKIEDTVDYTVLSNKHWETGNLTVYDKCVRYNIEEPVDWEFALVFDRSSGKVCLISSYFRTPGTSRMEKIINNLIFL